MYVRAPLAEAPLARADSRAVLFSPKHHQGKYSASRRGGCFPPTAPPWLARGSYSNPRFERGLKTGPCARSGTGCCDVAWWHTTAVVVCSKTYVPRTNSAARGASSRGHCCRGFVYIESNECRRSPPPPPSLPPSLTRTADSDRCRGDGK